MQTVLITAALLPIVLMVLGAMGFVYWDIRRSLNRAVKAAEELSKKLNGMEDLGKIPTFIEGLTKVCGDQVKGIVQLEESVTKFRTILFNENAKAEREAFAPYDEGAAEAEWQIQQMVAAGFSREEAVERSNAARKNQGTFRLK